MEYWKRENRQIRDMRKIFRMITGYDIVEDKNLSEKTPKQILTPVEVGV
jgi:hypothetical protein